MWGRGLGCEAVLWMSAEGLAAMSVSGSQTLTRQDSPGPGSSGVFFKIHIHSQGSQRLYHTGLDFSLPHAVVVSVDAEGTRSPCAGCVGSTLSGDRKAQKKEPQWSRVSV